MSLADALAQERRARLAAERLLELKQKELLAANAQLSRHALTLTDEIVEKREEVEEVRHVAEELRGEKEQVLQDLEQAHEEVNLVQRRLWHSVETIQDGFAVFDKNDTLLVANPAYLAVFDEMECVAPGISYRDIIQILVEEGIVDTGDLDPQAWCADMLERWKSPQPKARTIKLWNNRFVKLMDRRSATGDTVSLALDITDTIRREKDLEEALLRAESANRAKSAFLAKMSHELRTPMNGVVGMADLLCETSLDEEQKLFVDTIRSSGESLLKLINDVLDFSKMEAAKLVLHKEEFDLERTLTEVLMLFQPAVKEKAVDLVVDYDMFLPTTFIGDPGRFRQILTNLIGNAVKFTSSGHVMVRAVGLPDGDTDNYRIHVSVEDTGPGIPADMIDHIFGEFNQVEDEQNRKFEGTGLGLAITKQLVTLMGGKIWVDSEEGKGSNFGFYVPLPAPKTATFHLDTIPNWVDRIIMVSRPSQAARILTSQLQILGAEVAARTPDDFIANPETRPGDVVVIDAERTMRTGSRVIRAIRESGARVPVVLMQNLQDNDDSAGYEPLQMVNKPTGRKILINAIAAFDPPVKSTDDADPAPVAAELGAAPAPDHGPVAVAPEGLRKMRVLAAEDNKTNRLVFSKLVRKLDVDLAFAENGVEAVEKWKELRPDILFMDISMPIMDGKEATRRIREIEAAQGVARTPIVALTAHALSGDDEEILAAGLDHYLTKPLKKDAIFEQISKAVPENVIPPFAEDEPVQPGRLAAN